MAVENESGTQGGSEKGAENAFDPRTVAAAMLAKANGDATKVIGRLLRENHGYRTQIGDLKTKLPGEGSAVLTKEDATAWTAYRELGTDPKKLKEQIEAGTKALGELTEIRRDSSYEQAAKAAGFNPTLFKKLAKADGLNVSVEDVSENGKAAKKAFVLTDDKGGKAELSQWVKANWAELSPSLGGEKTEERRRGTPRGGDDNPPAPRPGSHEDTVKGVIRALGGSASYPI